MRYLTFPEPEHSNVHAVEAAHGFVWAGICRAPSLLLRITPDLQRVTPIEFDSEAGLHDLASEGTHVWVAHSSGHLSRVDPATGERVSRRIPTSDGQRNFLYCLTFDGDHLWTGTYTAPGRVFRIHPADFSHEEIVLPEAPNHSVRALVPTPEALWVGLYTVPGRVVVIDRTSLQQRTIDLGDESILCTSGAFDGRFIWLGLDTMPARVLRIDPETHEVHEFDLWPESSCVRGMAFDGRYLWLGLYTDPGVLVRFDPETAEWERAAMQPEFANVRDLALQGDTLCAVTQNLRYEPSGICALDVSEVAPA
jgi:streptogramin lyase